MDEEERAATAPRYRSRAEAAQLAAEFEASGVTRREFCAKHDMTVSTLDAYRKRFGRRAGAKAASKPAASGQWLAVEVSERQAVSTGAGSGLAVALPGGRRIEIGRGFDTGTLRQLVRVLEQI